MPVELSNPAFHQWVLFLVAFLLVADRVWSIIERVQGRKETVTLSPQPVLTAKVPMYMEKREAEERISGILARLTTMEQRLETEYRGIIAAGEMRLQQIREALHQLQLTLVEKIEEQMQAVYHRINEQESRLARLEGRAEAERRKP